jgi:hypothetical protein
MLSLISSVNLTDFTKKETQCQGVSLGLSCFSDGFALGFYGASAPVSTWAAEVAQNQDSPRLIPLTISFR